MKPHFKMVRARYIMSGDRVSLGPTDTAKPTRVRNRSEDVIQIERKWAKAWMYRDILADTYVFVEVRP